MSKPVSVATARGLIADYMKADIPVFLSGPPGVGKSAIVAQIAAEEYGGNIRDNRASQLDPVDVRGLPYVEGGVAHWARPDIFPAEDDKRPGILFWDELNGAPMAVQLALYQVILDRRVGAHIIPRNYKMIAAGNRVKDRAAAGKLSTALANRFAHIEIAPDVPAWLDWAIGAGLHPLAVAFIKLRPHLLHIMPGEDRTGAGGHKMEMSPDAVAFPTPRSWEAVSRVMDSGNLQRLAEGLIGEGPAGELVGFVRMALQLPKIERILADPGGAPVPDDLGARYAVAMALAHSADASNMGAVAQYAMRLPPDFGVLTMESATRRAPDLKTAPGYARWAVANQGRVA